ncbi:Bardet-Biedl syndrome 1 protein [Dinochytrium kinnereticum]|nr:Bardet-Biedl syndrome 1 protein [Dinochytrium kinnereticum]
MLALASGPSIYMYRNRQPFYKFSLPAVSPDPMEAEVWSNLAEAAGGVLEGDGMDPVVIESAFFRLTHLRELANVFLTERSRRFLVVGGEEREGFVRRSVGFPLVVEPVITCMTTLPRSNNPTNPIGCLVIGSEERVVYIISPPNYSIIEKFQLSSPVVFLSTWGCYEDGGYRIAAACRDNHVYMVAPDICYRIIQVQVPACGLILFEKSIVVACMNHSVYSYHLKGRLLFVRAMPAPIVALCDAKYPEKSLNGYVVALMNGEVRLYSDRNFVTAVYLNQPAVGIRFGVFGRESGALVMVQKDGALTVKILKRQANLEEMVGSVTGPPREQEVPIPVPRKTRLFVEQMNRERQKPGEIYKDFERDIARLRGFADTAFDRLARKNSETSLPVLEDIPVQLELELIGLGPEYHLILTCRNVGTKPIFNLVATVLGDPAIHQIDHPVILLVIISPNREVKRLTRVVTLDGNSAGAIKVYLSDGRESMKSIKFCDSPIVLTATVDVPVPGVLRVD